MVHGPFSLYGPQYTAITGVVVEIIGLTNRKVNK